MADHASIDHTGVTGVPVAGYTPGGTDVPVPDGGTGASTASGARTNLGLVIGTDVAAATHASTHEDGGADELTFENLATAETDTTKRARPNGTGGVEWVPGSGAGGDAEDIAYDNATSGLTATDVQAAIDEVAAAGGGGGGGGLVLLEQHTASASATLDFTSCISSTYDDYVIRIINLLPATDVVDLQLLASTDGGSSWLGGTDYGFVNARLNGGAGSIAGDLSTGAAAASLAYSGGLIGNSATYGGARGQLQLFNPLSAAAYKHIDNSLTYHYTDGTFLKIYGGVYIKTATAINALRFKMSSGNIASGTIRVYGVEK